MFRIVITLLGKCLILEYLDPERDEGMMPRCPRSSKAHLSRFAQASTAEVLSYQDPHYSVNFTEASIVSARLPITTRLPLRWRIIQCWQGLQPDLVRLPCKTVNVCTLQETIEDGTAALQALIHSHARLKTLENKAWIT